MFCSSYTEASKFRCNAAATQGVDNVDHATRTLDGHGAVHVMGQMATFTPGIQSARTVPRVKVNMDDVMKIGHVTLILQKDPKPALNGIVYTRLG